MNKILKNTIKVIGTCSAVIGTAAFVQDQIEQKNNPSNHVPYGPYEKYFKRPLDAVLSAGAIVGLSPVMGVTALLVRKNLGSPVIFTQKRPGKDGKIFKLYKFRSMTDEKDENGNLLPDKDRLPRFGKKLRSTSLDELPELFNIFNGDMSVVGPRPLAIVYLPYYTSRERHRHDVRPGLTGLAQVSGRNSISWDTKFNYDIEYIKNLSFVNDVRIVLLTVKKVFIQEGIGQGEQHPGNLYDVRTDWLDDNGKIKSEYQDDRPI